MKNLKPYCIEDSRIPLWVSKITKLNVWAVSFFIFVFCAGKLDERVKRHETIHFQQQLELLFVFQWVLYGIFWLIGMIKYRNTQEAYLQNPFEQEAYNCENIENYLSHRIRYNWLFYKI
jgi:cbb3-type cytochrome oxidase subunit 1